MTMDNVSFKRPRLVNRPWFLFRRIARNWPFLLWLGILVFIAAFYSRNQQFGEIGGTVEVVEQSVAPIETARLAEIAVEPGQRVRAGDVIARMDTALVEAELAIQQSTLRDARENVTTFQQRMLTASGDAQMAVRNVEASLRATQLEQQREAAELEQLQKELKRREGLLAQRFIDELQVNELRPQIASLEKALAAYPELVETYRQTHEMAVRQRDLLQSWLRAANGSPLENAVSNKTESSAAIVEASRDLVLRRKESYALRAARDGVVARVYVLPGNVVAAGVPVASIVGERPTRVVGFLPEARLADLSAGDRVHVWRLNGRADPVEAVVSSVSLAVEALPVRINPLQVQVQGGQPLRGRRILFDLIGPHSLSPGESVEIRELRRGWLAFLDDVERFFTHRLPWLFGRSNKARTDGQTAP
jgi:multidrug resistance efflux pump